MPKTKKEIISTGPGCGFPAYYPFAGRVLVMVVGICMNTRCGLGEAVGISRPWTECDAARHKDLCILSLDVALILGIKWLGDECLA